MFIHSSQLFFNILEKERKKVLFNLVYIRNDRSFRSEVPKLVGAELLLGDVARQIHFNCNIFFIIQWGN